ncbi:MAG TPA: DUF4446 family protein [Nocardioidaceae bacterium]|jgi:hypothetical protein|nr:DUF4446 family protein [Nocardioidaceae bacterium]
MDVSLLAALVLALLVVSLAALVVGILALRRTSQHARRTSRRNPATVPADLEGLRGEVQALRVEAAEALRHLAVVRYDAFGDMGGRLSWSLALLDEAGNGVVLTSIHGRSEARTYAKNIAGWSCDQQLSPEEEEAVSAARAE